MKTFINRFKWRVLLSLFATIVAFAVVQPIALATGVPEVARVLPALAVLYWLEMSVTIGRAMFSHRLDFQAIALKATFTPSGAAVIACLIALNTIFRLGVLVWIVYVA